MTIGSNFMVGCQDNNIEPTMAKVRYHVVQGGNVLFTYFNEYEAMERANRHDDWHVSIDVYDKYKEEE
jgi:hypothetical protein